MNGNLTKKLKSIRSDPALLFAAFMFTQLVVLRAANQAGRGYLSDDLQVSVYCLFQPAVILGFLLHACLSRRLKNGAVCLRVAAVCSALLFAGACALLLSPTDSVFYLTVTGFSVFLLGMLGGAVYLRLASYAASGAKIGAAFGVGYASAIALQYVFQLRWFRLPALLILLAASFLCLLLSFLRAASDPARTTLPAADAAPAETRMGLKIACAVVITAAMLIFSSYFNTYIHHLQVASGYTTYNVYTWPRLLMIPGVLLFGLIGDLKNGKYLPVAALSVVVLAQLNAVLIGDKTHLLNMCLYYLSLTAAVSYYHLTFLRLAPATKRPALWAPAGRMLDSAAVVLAFLLGYADFSAPAVLLIDIAALIVILVLMAVSGGFNLSSHHAAPPPAYEPLPAYEARPASDPQEAYAPQPACDPFPALQARYHITPSELNVLRELVLTDDKQEAIAERLGISVSTLRHHITSIYRKTDTQSRAALCKLASRPR